MARMVVRPARLLGLEVFLGHLGYLDHLATGLPHQALPVVVDQHRQARDGPLVREIFLGR